MNREPVVVAHELSKRYGDLVAVRAIDFAIQHGECFGFLGPNGAGKTTTMKMIYCASPLTSGSLLVAGLDVRTQARRIKALIGVVPQENNLDPDLSVRDNLLVYARYFDLPRKIALVRARESLELMQLEDRASSKIEDLSGGMKRRLIISRSLINQPRLLILDEPTTGLDPQARHLVWQRLRLLKSQGVTMALTTHYMEEAEQLCDRLVIMHEGRILAQGAPREMIREHVGQSVLELRLGDSVKAQALSQLGEWGCQVEDVGDSVHVFSRDDGHKLDSLPSKLAVEVESYVYRRAGLEDVFLKLAGRDLRD